MEYCKVPALHRLANVIGPARYPAGALSLHFLDPISDLL